MVLSIYWGRDENNTPTGPSIRNTERKGIMIPQGLNVLNA